MLKQLAKEYRLQQSYVCVEVHYVSFRILSSSALLHLGNKPCQTMAGGLGTDTVKSVLKYFNSDQTRT